MSKEKKPTKPKPLTAYQRELLENFNETCADLPATLSFAKRHAYWVAKNPDQPFSARCLWAMWERGHIPDTMSLWRKKHGKA